MSLMPFHIVKIDIFNENQCLVCCELKLALIVLFTNNFPHKEVLARFCTATFNSSDQKVFIVGFFYLQRLTSKNGRPWM